MVKDKDAIATEFRRRKGITNQGLSQQITNTRDCQAFYSGNFMTYIDSLVTADIRGNRKQSMVQFNMVKPYVNCVRGFMAQNRRNADYVARVEENKGQQLYSEFANALKDYVRDNANADQVETQQDGDMLICGYGAVETALSYGDGYSSRNPNGEIIMGRLDPRCIGWDPTARQANLLDARWVYYEKIYPLQEALDLFDNSAPEDFEEEQGFDDGNKVFNPRGGRYNKIQEVYDYENEDEDLVKVYFYQWYDIEKFYRARNPLKNITDPQTYAFSDQILQEIAAEQDADDDYRMDPRADIISCDLETKKKVEEAFEGLVDFVAENRRVYYTAVISGHKVFTTYRSPCQTGFTIKFKTGDYDEENHLWVGMVNSLKDPSLYYNKALTELMFTIASQAKGGVYVERSAIENITDFEAKYAKTDAVMVMEDGAVSGNKIMPKKETYTANGLEQVLQLSGEALTTVSGIDKNFLGSSENKQETATLQRQRIRQVTTALATYFDNITLYQKESAQLFMSLMRILVENNDGQMFKAMTSDGDLQFLKMDPTMLVSDYDIMINEAPSSPMQKEERAEMLGKVADRLFSANDPQTAKSVLSIAVKYMDMDFDDQQKLHELLSGGQPIDPKAFAALQQQVQQLTGQAHQVQMRDTMAKTTLNMVKAEEGIANIKLKNADTGMKKAMTQQELIENQIIAADPHKDVRVNA